VTRELDWIRVNGKTQPVAIYELVGEAADVSDARRDAIACYAEGLARYRDGRWRDAIVAFGEALFAKPDDGPSKVMKIRSRLYEQNAPFAWDGIHGMTTK
jgi:hypothetical protein